MNILLVLNITKAKQSKTKEANIKNTHLPHSDPAFKTYSDNSSIASAVNLTFMAGCRLYLLRYLLMSAFLGAWLNYIAAAFQGN